MIRCHRIVTAWWHRQTWIALRHRWMQRFFLDPDQMISNDQHASASASTSHLSRLHSAKTKFGIPSPVQPSLSPSPTKAVSSSSSNPCSPCQPQSSHSNSSTSPSVSTEPSKKFSFFPPPPPPMPTLSDSEFVVSQCLPASLGSSSSPSAPTSSRLSFCVDHFPIVQPRPVIQTNPNPVTAPAGPVSSAASISGADSKLKPNQLPSLLALASAVETITSSPTSSSTVMTLQNQLIQQLQHCVDFRCKCSRLALHSAELTSKSSEYQRPMSSSSLLMTTVDAEILGSFERVCSLCTFSCLVEDSPSDVFNSILKFL